MHGHILTVIPYSYIYNFTDFKEYMTYTAHKVKKPLRPLVKTVGSLVFSNCPQTAHATHTILGFIPMK